MYKMYLVKEVKHELSPPGILTFKLLLQETDCRKNNEYLENMEKFLKECYSTNISKPIQQCKVSVRPTKLEEFQQLQFTIDECKRLTSQFPIMVGSVKPMNVEERMDPLFQSVIDQIVEQYNAQSNSLYLFTLENLLEATAQVDSARLTCANNQPYADSFWKTVPDEYHAEGYWMQKWFSRHVPFSVKHIARLRRSRCVMIVTFKHCQVSVLQKLWMASTTINFTQCWESVLVLQPVVGVWEEITTEQLSDQTFERILENSLMTYKNVYDNQSDYAVDYVTDARRLKVGLEENLWLVDGSTDYFFQVNAHEMDIFTLHLKGKSTKENATTLCKVRFWQRPWINEETLEVIDCNVKQTNNDSFDVHSLTEDQQSKADFKELLFRVVSVFNLKTEHSVLYQPHVVEDLLQTVGTVYFHLTNGGLQSVYPGEYKFKLFLRPTKCKKWADAAHFYENNLTECHASVRQHVVICEVKITHENNTHLEENIELSGCRYLYVGSPSNRRALASKELADVKFQEIVDTAVNTFNLKTTSTHWFKLFAVENAAVEVQYWNRGWIEVQETLDVKDCVIVTQPIAERETELGDSVQKANRESCAESLLPRLIHMFNNRTGLAYIYDKRPTIHELQEHPVPGTRLTFDLYLEPNQGQANCSISNETGSRCPLDKHFYTCKATYWARPWMNDEVLELTQCMMIEANLFNFDSHSYAGGKQALREMTDQAIELYNTNLANNYIFGSKNITNVSYEFAGGLKATFSLNMRPIACKLKREKTGCDLPKTVVRAHCFVTVWYRPWMQQPRQLFLTKCREYFDGKSSTKPQPLSNKERNTPGFKSMLDIMITMYKPPVPLTYEVEKILNAKVNVDSQWRNITFNLFLKPNGCNQTLPNADDPRCVNWEKQDTVRCEAEISDLAGDNGGKRVYLRNCQILWKRESKRPLNSEELQATWFKESVQSAWKLQQSVRQQANFYAVVDMEDATIERDQEEVVEYTLQFEETECAKDNGEESFVNGVSESCPVKDDPDKMSCRIVLTRKPNGYHHLKANCQAQM
ncbi:uncharacterized protein DEA37_0004132 [Paragonimus westermani]|uniref:Uncharacterized protein n=1 Tax=Paragonimus westermani TaxID=34504 RepID=A0A5J4NKZ6_9TREM|nr:uncharacterized protein DEA37_0004132 [Paragonimus westermani]